MAVSSPIPHALMLLSDEEIVARIVLGDGALLELLMRRHNQRLYRVARSVVRNEHEAEDIVQEAYVRAFTNLHRFEGRSSVATWLTRIAFHEALRRRRRHKARQGTLDQLDHAADAASGITPLESAAETRAMLTKAVDSLPAGLRAVVMLRLVQGLGTRETAACLRLSEANVKVSLHRARRLLFDHLTSRPPGGMAEQFAFKADRCDRIVAGVLRRLATA